MANERTKKRGVVKRVLFFLKFLEIRLRFVLILAITALAVGDWDHIENYYERWQRQRAAGGHADHVETVDSEYEYYCGMHPFVVRDRPGKCPICGMDLTRRAKGEAATLPEGTLARVQASPGRVMQAGVQVEPALYRLLARNVESYGVIEVDETRVSNVVARFPGRVERLHVETTGEPVRKGQPLAEIYSPSFLAGADEYVRALNGYRRLAENARVSDKEKERAKRLVDGARRRLELAGFTPDQLDAIAEGGAPRSRVTLYSPVGGTILEKTVVEGQAVEEGTPIYTVADLSTLWVQAQVLESDLAAVDAGMPVEVTSVAYPGEIFYGTVDFIYPEVNPENRSVKVRVVVGNPDGKLKPGMYVNTALRSPIGRYGPEGSFALAKAEGYGNPAEELADAPAHDHGDAAAPELPTKTAEDKAKFLATLADGDEYYYCTMCDEVATDNPEHRCPICGMKLTQTHKGAEGNEAAEAQEQAGPAPGGLPTSTPEAAAEFLAKLPAGGEYYTCSMDPEVVSDKPGECPLCGMDLIEAAKPADAEAPGGGSYERLAVGYACPMHPDELVDKPGVCGVCGCGMKMQKLQVERVLSVPESAVVDTGARQIVYVETEPGMYEARAVTLGPHVEGYYPVLDGLVLGQRVATQGSFLLDAEARLNPSISGLGAEQPDDDAPAAEAPASAPAHRH